MENFFQLFQSRTRFVRFMGCIFIGLPIWYAIGILVTFSPEFAKALNIDGTITAGDAIMFSYIGLAVGDMISGLASQILGSRKKIVALFIIFTLSSVLLFLFLPIRTTGFFYFTCFLVGVSIGYWALFVTIAAEQFGTNLRSTVATTVPNFIRGTVVPLTLAFKFLRGEVGVIYGALIIGVITIIVAFIALSVIDETFGRDLDFEETD